MQTEMWTIIATNDTTAEIMIEDLGISFAAAESITMSSQFTYDELAGSDDLRREVADGNISLNDGTETFNAVRGSKWLLMMNTKRVNDLFWNIRSRVQQLSSSPPGSPTEGMTYLDTDDNKIYVYDSTATIWVDNGTAVEYDAVIDLSSGTENIFEYRDGAWVEQGIPRRNTSAMVEVDGTDPDALGSMYRYDIELNQWVKIADEPPGGADTNTQNTLDEAYDEGGPGAGRTIDVDSGPVQLDATSGTDAPLELTDLNAYPTTNLAAGQISVKDGELVIYDATRSKWISIARDAFVFGRRGNSKDQYLTFSAGALASNNSGLRMGQDATIVGITAQLDASGTCDIRVRKNDAAGNIASLSIAAALGAQDMTLNVDLAQGDFLQCYIEATTAVEDPMVIVHIAYRP